jgi:two-component system sensor histidine kinase TctE
MLSAAPDDRVFYRVVGPDRRTVTGYADLPDAPQRGRAASDSDPSGHFYDARYRGADIRMVSLAREIAQPGTTGWVYVQVGQTRRARDALTRDLVFGSLAPILLMTIVALGVVWFGVTLALRPLDKLSSELANRQPEDLNPVVTPVPAEIAPVADSINGFMGRLRGNIDTLRSFIGDAAHQLRTPLAVIQAQAQVAEDGDAAEMRGSLVAIRRNAAKLTRLVNQMLSDATVQHRSDVRVFAEFDLLATVRQSVREAVPMTEDSDVRFTSPLSEARMVGDRLMIGEVVKNLIQNALTHGRSEHGEVSLKLVETPEGYLLGVADRGKGIRAEDREQVFERFARRNNDEPGAGLGLAIVRRAVESHRGTITLSDREGGGLLVEVALPRRVKRP